MVAGHQDNGLHGASASAIASIASHSSRRSSRHGRRGKRRTGPTASASASGYGMHESSSEEFSRLLESEGGDGAGMSRIIERQDVFHLVHEIRKDLRKTIDTHLSWEELSSIDLNFTIVRPLAIKYAGYRSIAILYCLMLNRIHFQREANRDLAFQSVNVTRAALCELLTMKLLRTFSNDGLELVTALSASFHPLAGATDAELAEMAATSSAIDLEEIKQEGLPAEQFASTLELAIQSKAKKLISSPLCQRCIDGIWHGKVVLSPVQASHALIDDSYKKRALSIYDPHKAPLLNHLRLRVPMYRSRLEFFNFFVILVLYVLALGQKGSPTWTLPETLFALYALGFAVDELAQLQERGLSHYLTSFYNLLDCMFCAISLCWLGLRISALRHGLPARSDLSFDVLALGAVLLCPRVASSLIQDNVVMLSLKAMISDFAFFTVLACVVFSGFAFSFHALASDPRWTVKEVLWLMLKVWFGSSYLGFDESKSFTLEFGPPLMVLYTILSNTLLLTVLISLLSNTFQVVAMNAGEEAMYQFACKTMAGITTDALFSYQPPFNLVAVVIILPIKWALSPRWLHKVNVFLIRLTSFPVLLTIRFFELHSFGAGISLSAEKGRSFLSWMPIINSSLDAWAGNGGMDVVEAAFEYRIASSSSSSSSSESDGEAEGQQSDADDSDSDDSKRGRRRALKHDVDGSWEERAAERFDQTVSDHGTAKQKESKKERRPSGDQASKPGSTTKEETARPAEAATTDAAAEIPHKSNSSAEPAVTATDKRHDGDAARQPPHARRPQRTKTLPTPPRKGFEPRGLGSLSSPLAKLYGRFNNSQASQLPAAQQQRLTKSSSTDSAACRRKSKSVSARAHDVPAVAAAETLGIPEEGGERALDSAAVSPSRSPVGRDEASETRHLMEKLREMEARNKRIEDLLLKIMEEKHNSY